MDEKEINRMLIHFERLFREANKTYINPKIDELTVDDLAPIVNMVAHSRAEYLRYVYDLGKKFGDNGEFPSAEELKKLKVLRMRFNEVAEGSLAFETCIQRGYLDLKVDM